MGSNNKDASLIGGDNTYQGAAVVAFIDLLGFSNYIKTHWESKEKVDATKELILNLKEDAYEREAMNDYRVTFEDGTKENVKVKSTIKTFSDSFMIICPIDQPHSITRYWALRNVCDNILNIWMNAIFSGFTIRGGISYGEIFWNEDEIIGPAFIEAYELESKKAVNSRVILSDTLIDLIKGLNENEFRRLSGYLFSDSDTRVSLNPRYMPTNGEIEEQILLECLVSCQKETTKPEHREKYDSVIKLLQEAPLRISFVQEG